MENVFDTLCSALSEPSTKDLFLKSEGIDLMVLTMKLAVSFLIFIRDSDYINAEKNCNLVHERLKRLIMPCRDGAVVPAAKLSLKRLV